MVNKKYCALIVLRDATITIYSAILSRWYFMSTLNSLRFDAQLYFLCSGEHHRYVLSVSGVSTKPVSLVITISHRARG